MGHAKAFRSDPAEIDDTPEGDTVAVRVRTARHDRLQGRRLVPRQPDRRRRQPVPALCRPRGEVESAGMPDDAPAPPSHASRSCNGRKSRPGNGGSDPAVEVCERGIRCRNWPLEDRLRIVRGAKPCVALRGGPGRPDRGGVSTFHMGSAAIAPEAMTSMKASPRSVRAPNPLPITRVGMEARSWPDPRPDEAQGCIVTPSIHAAKGDQAASPVPLGRVAGRPHHGLGPRMTLTLRCPPGRRAVTASRNASARGRAAPAGEHGHGQHHRHPGQ